jgi:hypothetical protein
MYLGILLNYNGVFTNTQKMLSNQGKKAVLSAYISKYRLSIFNLYDWHPCLINSISMSLSRYENFNYEKSLNSYCQQFHQYKMNNHLSPQLVEHKHRPQHTMLEIHILAWDRHNDVYDICVNSHFAIHSTLNIWGGDCSFCTGEIVDSNYLISFHN